MATPVLTIVKEITINLDQPNDLTYVLTKQYDSIARKVKINFLNNNEPWIVPSNITGIVRFKKPDGTYGMYDTDEDDNPAIEFVSGASYIIVTLANQVLTISGRVNVEINFYSAAAEKLTAFRFPVFVEESALSDIPFVSSNYYNVLRHDIAEIRSLNAAFKDAIEAAVEGQIVIDPSLSIEGAVAEASATGELVRGFIKKEQYDFTDTPEQLVTIHSNNKWKAIDSTENSRSYVIQIPSGSKTLKFKNTSSINSIIAFLKTNSMIPATDPDFSYEYPTRIIISPGSEVTYDTPSDANYIYLLKTSGNGTYCLCSLEYRFLETDKTISKENAAADAHYTRVAIDDAVRALKDISLSITGIDISNTDFNTLTQAGLYRVGSISTEQASVLNRPSEIGGVLIVIPTSSESTIYLVQVYITKSDFYIRYNANSGWGAWRTIIESSNEAIYYHGALSSDTNIDSLGPGIYMASTNESARSTYLNSPTSNRFCLLVLGTAQTSYYETQFAFDIFGNIFTRFKTNSETGFTQWYSQYSDAYKISDITVINNLFGSFRQGSISSASGQDTSHNAEIRIRTIQYFLVIDDINIFILDSTKQLYIMEYDLDTNYLGATGWLSAGQKKEIKKNTKVRVVVRNADNSNITPTDACDIYAEPMTIWDGIPDLYLNGDISEMSKDISVTLSYKIFDLQGTCTCKWQGSSSQRYVKKNYTIKFDTGFDAWSKWLSFLSNWKKSNGILTYDESSTKKTWTKNENEIIRDTTTDYTWGSRKKYVAKANWVDPSQARNIVNARLWGQIVNTRENPVGLLGSSFNHGAIDGFPVHIILNGSDYGLYTLNTPKDEDLFNMGDSATEYFMVGEVNSGSSAISKIGSWLHTIGNNVQALYDNDSPHAYAIEYPDVYGDDGTPTTETLDKFLEIKDSLDAAISASLNAGENWETDCANYIDIDSVIDYYIFACCIGDYDGMARNIIYGTYDGQKWFMSAYDLDTTYGVNPYGSIWWDIENGRNEFSNAAEATYDPVTNNYTYPTTSNRTKHRLFHLIHKYSRRRLIDRYRELRKTVLSESNVWYEFSNFIQNISVNMYNTNAQIWTGLLGTANTNMHQYMDYYRMHCKLLDDEIDVLESTLDS